MRVDEDLDGSGAAAREVALAFASIACARTKKDM